MIGVMMNDVIKIYIFFYLGRHYRPLLLPRINFNPSMDK